jgi:hypothetical protein
MGLEDIPAIVAYRVLPFAVYVSFANGIAWTRRLSIWVLFLGLLMLTKGLGGNLSEVLVHGPTTLIYFAVLSLGVYELNARFGGLEALGFLIPALCVMGYVLVPALFEPSPLVLATVGIGWEAMLSAYSYWRELAPGRRRAREWTASFSFS